MPERKPVQTVGGLVGNETLTAPNCRNKQNKVNCTEEKKKKFLHQELYSRDTTFNSNITVQQLLNSPYYMVLKTKNIHKHFI